MLRLEPATVPDNAARGPIELRGERISVGRAATNAVVLRDTEVSKRHAEILPGQGQVTVVDLGSSNGTYVNERPVQRAALKPGDRVRFGGCTYVLTDVVEERPDSVTILPEGADRTHIITASRVADFLPATSVRDAAELRRSYERLRSGFEAVRRLIAITDVRQLCDDILDVAFTLTKPETGAVLLYGDGEELEPWASRAEHPSGHPVISRTIIDRVVGEHAAILASDALMDRRFSSAASIVLSNTRSVMCVPLASQDELYGILHVASGQQDAFSGEDLDLLSGIGGGAAVALANAYLSQDLAEQARARESLGRFLSPAVLEEVVANRVELRRGGEERDVTVLFADIRGFTSLTEQTPPTAVVALLNEYFDQMVEIVFRHGGVLDKFIGDALMAVWGTPVVSPDDAQRAVAAAVEMQETLVSFNAYRRDAGKTPVEVGIGLASGRCVAGAIGARRRMEYTVIGDAVNLASRLSGLASAGQVMCDETTYQLGGRPAGAVPLPAARVKGKAQAVPVFRLFGA